MASSESEDFESADEGTTTVDKKDRKKRNSSSNYSDNALEDDLSAQKISTPPAKSINKTTKEPTQTEGWEDFDIETDEPIKTEPSATVPSTVTQGNSQTSSKTDSKKDSSKNTGWEDFGDDWGDDQEPKTKQNTEEKDIKQLTERLAATSTSKSTESSSSGGWGWGWGVDSLLSTATAGIGTITNQVSQGLSTVLESSIGIPDPEELAKQTAKDKDSKPETPKAESATEKEDDVAGGDGAYSFGNLLKFVGDTGSKVIHGGLDTLETIGRKTMEVLQEDPEKKRAIMGFFDPHRPVLSQVLREAKAKAEEEDKIKEEKMEAKLVHYENLFDDFDGLVHLEALEMLSKRVSLRIEERVQSAPQEERYDVKETLQQVAELLEFPEEDESDDEETIEKEKKYKLMSKPDALLARLQDATEKLGVKLQFQPLVKQYTEILDYMTDETNDFSDKTMYKKAISSLAQATALCMEIYHKAGEMVLVKERRYTADESDGFVQLTLVLEKHMNEIANVYSENMSNKSTFHNGYDCREHITNIYLEAENSAKYIQNAFELVKPMVQIGYIPYYTGEEKCQ